jgi:hypothetical protein
MESNSCPQELKIIIRNLARASEKSSGNLIEDSLVDDTMFADSHQEVEPDWKRLTGYRDVDTPGCSYKAKDAGTQQRTCTAGSFRAIRKTLQLTLEQTDNSHWSLLASDFCALVSATPIFRF